MTIFSNWLESITPKKTFGATFFHHYLTATFVGEDGSLGYKKGQSYTLRVTQFREGMEIHISIANSEKGKCVYSSLYKFFQNWENVSQMK